MMFPMLNSLELAFYIILLFCPAYAFFTKTTTTKPLFRHDGVKKLHSLWGRANYKISYGLCDWMRFEVNCAKSHHHIMSEALLKQQPMSSWYEPGM